MAFDLVQISEALARNAVRTAETTAAEAAAKAPPPPPSYDVTVERDAQGKISRMKITPVPG
jgi:hypothetical protein